jgi:hypothetical protein
VVGSVVAQPAAGNTKRERHKSKIFMAGLLKAKRFYRCCKTKGGSQIFFTSLITTYRKAYSGMKSADNGKWILSVTNQFIAVG